jgi:VanZ family protein
MLPLPNMIHFLIRSRVFWWMLLACWAGTVFLLSAMPNVNLPQVSIPNFDKVEHTLCFCVGAMILTAALGATFPGWPWRRRILLAVVAVSLFGCADEWHQTFTPGRSGNDFYDWLSDTIGALIGALSAYRIHLYAGNLPQVRQTASPAAHRDLAS